MDKPVAICPLETLMTQLGLTNAALVKASTEQLTFKMVHKGRIGRRLTPNVQEKIHNALLAAKPEIKIRRRDLFRYPPSPELVASIQSALSLVHSGKIRYPEFVDLLAQAGVNVYLTEIALHRTAYFALGGEAHVEQGLAISAKLGDFDQGAIQSAIADAQKASIDYPTFLKRIHQAGITSYEVNIRNRKIVYKGEEHSYRETIPSPGQASEKALSSPPQAQPGKSALSKKKIKPKNKQKSLTRKARLTSNKRYRQRRKAKRQRSS